LPSANQKPAPAAETPPPPVSATNKPPNGDQGSKETVIDMAWLRESLETLQWADVGKWLANKYKVSGKRVSEIVAQLTVDQKKEFALEVEDRLKMQG